MNFKKALLLASFAVSMATTGMSQSKLRPLQKVEKDGVSVFVFQNAHLYLDTANVKIGDELVVNGPLFEADGNPVGGYISPVSENKYTPAKNSPLHKKPLTDVAKSTGNFAMNNYVFGQNKDGSFFMEVYDASRKMEDRDAAFAIQNGMGLIVNGKNICNAQSKNVNTRCGIGYNSKTNELIFVDSQNKGTFWDLAAKLQEFGADNAIYLDGAINGYINNMQKHGNIPMNDGRSTNVMKMHIY